MSGSESIGRDEAFMRQALALAERAAAAGEVPIGALVVVDETVIGEGWNRPIASHDPSAHAEINALRAAGEALGAYRLPGATLYVTLEPCPMCVGALVHARVARVVYGAADPKTGACGGALALHEHPGHNHHFTVVGGILADRCRERLRGFFHGRRAERRPAVRLVRLTPDNAEAYRELGIEPRQREFVNPAAEVIDRHFAMGYAEALYGIEAAGEPAGLLALLPPEQGIDYRGRGADEAWLEAFRVDARFQGRGVATRALEAVAAIAHTRYTRLSLTVNLRNDKAEAAYRRFGFRDTGELYHGGPSGPQRILTLALNEETFHGEGA